MAIHGGHEIVKRFVMSFFCTHHHKSSQQFGVREQALGALPRLRLCPPCSLRCGPPRPFGPAHCLPGRILKDISLVGSKASGSIPWPVCMKSQFYACPNHSPNTRAHAVLCALGCPLLLLQQRLRPGSPFLQAPRCRAGHSTENSLAITRHPAARPHVPAAWQRDGAGRLRVDGRARNKEKQFPPPGNGRSPPSRLPGSQEF